MSQPPPPHQPPPGGSGAGETPSYGYPQTPPPGQPGGGYPQTPPPTQPGAGYPPTPPPGQPSYGYPHTPPPGQPPTDGAPGQAFPPGGYGPPTGQGPAPYPSQPGMPGGYAPGPPPPGGKRSKLVLIVAASVAALLAVGAGGWFVFQGGDGDEKSQSQEDPSETSGGGESNGTEGGGSNDTPQVINAEAAWQVKAPQVSKKDVLTDARGTWFSGKNLVKAMPSGVVAFDMDSGEQAWSLDLKRPKDCGVSTEASDNKIALTFGATCNTLAVVDIAQGTEVWRQKLPSNSGSKYEFQDASIGISGEVVAVNWSRNGFGYNLNDGSSLWKGESKGECYLDGYVGGEQLLARHYCYSSDYSAKSYELQGLDAQGKKQWAWRAPKDVVVKRILSQTPLTVGVSAGGGDVTDVMVVKEGKLTQKIAIDPERYDLYCSGTMLTGCPGAVVDDNTLFLATKDHEGAEEYSKTNEIVAFDLSSGKAKWQVQTLGDGEMAPVGMENGKLIAYQKGDYRTPGKVLEVDLKTQKAHPRMNLPESSAKLERELSYTPNTRPYWRDGHFFLVSERFYSGKSLSKYAIIAFK